MPRHWRFASHDRGVVDRISREMGCSPLLAQVLAARGIEDGQQAKQFLSAKMTDLHHPDLLPGISEAADRIASAIRAGRRITVYGDYDVDGVTATSILWHCVKLAGGTVDYYIPSRLEEGYGLNLDAIRTLHEEDPNRLVVTVDCGICSIEEAALARELGLELIITDHHTMLETLPDAAVNVHPRLPGSEYPFPDLCGAGVAFKLAWAISLRMGDGVKASPRMKAFLISSVALAAMGTVADVVPLVGENRILVKFGLKSLAETGIPGLEYLMKVAGIEKEKTLAAEDIGFALAPRINAAGRLGQARLAVELLTTDNRQRAVQLADYVDQLNKNRQTVERRMFRLAKELIEAHPEWNDHGGLVIAHEEFHPGVMGIVASRIAEAYQKPTVVIAAQPDSTVFQGSGRTCRDFDLHSGIAACCDLLEGFGGHRAAAGLRIQKDRIDEFREAFAQHVRLEEGEGTKPQPDLHVDAEVMLHDLTTKAVRELEQLGPFGSAHRRPIFSVSKAQLADAPTTMGGGNRHLSLKLRDRERVIRCVAFGKGDWAEEIAQAQGPLAFCFSAGINFFRGFESVELHLHDWQVSNVGQSSASPVEAVAD